MQVRAAGRPRQAGAALHLLRAPPSSLDPRGDREIHCPKCGHLNENKPVTCDTCDEPVGLKLKYDVDECQERGMTFAVPLKVTIRLVVWDKDPETRRQDHP